MLTILSLSTSSIYKQLSNSIHTFLPAGDRYDAPGSTLSRLGQSGQKVLETRQQQDCSLLVYCLLLCVSLPANTC